MQHGSPTDLGVLAIGLSGDFSPLEFIVLVVLGSLLGLGVRALQRRRR